MGVESYMHRFAKATLAGWLRERAEDAHRRDSVPYAELGPINWRVNRGSPHFGVWEEYPVSMDYGLLPVWDEYDGCVDDPPPRFQDAPPTRETCIEMGHRPEFIFDIAIQHKGHIVYGIEVVHKNDLSSAKIDKIKAAGRQQYATPIVYTVPAHWIMAQVGFPQNWAGERVL